MSTTSRRLAPYAALGSLLMLVALPLMILRPAWAGQTRTVDITANGPRPALLTAAAGDTIVFYNADTTFIHEVKSASPNWKFDTGPMPPGARVTAGTLTAAGQYDYAGANLDSFTGRVVVPAATGPAPSRSPAPRPSSTLSGSASPAPTGAGASPGPVTVPPPAAGGFGNLAGPGSPAPGATALQPNVAAAPQFPGSPVITASPGRTVAIGNGPLPEPPTGRRYGLPAALAAVAAIGVGTLLVRFLLAHPAARRRW